MFCHHLHQTVFHVLLSYHFAEFHLYFFMVVYLKQDFCYLLYAFYSRYGEEVYMTVAMLEEVFHLSGCPLYAECLCTMVSCESLAKGLMAGMIGIVIPILRALSTKS